MKKGLLALALALSSTPAFGQAITGNALHDACQSEDDPVKFGFCLVFVLGTWEGMHSGAFWAFIAETEGEGSLEDGKAYVAAVLGACVPTTVENPQIVDLVKSYLVVHPERRHQTAGLLIHGAMMDAFPCSIE